MGEQSLRIALICTERLPVPPIRGGAIQILIDGVLPHLSRDHQITVYSVSDPDLKSRERIGRVTHIRLPSKGYVLSVAEALASARASGIIYDVVHVFNRPKDLPIYKTAMPESEFVLSVHNEMFHSMKISSGRGQLAIRSAARIMTISDYIGKTIASRFPESKRKLTTMYSGIDLTLYTPVWTPEAQQIRQRLRKKYKVENKKVVLFVGRISEVKGPDILIKAMEKVVRDHPDSVLLIVGGKWYRNDRTDKYSRHLHELAERLKGRVRFTGFVQPKWIPSMFLIGDVFVCSSQWEEPLARVHYEAMGAGVPVITTNRGGNAEIITSGVNGIVIDDYKNPRAFASAITKLLSNPAEAEKLARAGRAFVERNHGFEHAAGRLARVYLDVHRQRSTADGGRRKDAVPIF